MKFAHDMVTTKQELDKLGHEAFVPFGTDPHLEDGSFVEDLDGNLSYCIENNVMKDNFGLVEDCDAILVLNKRRNEIDGYIGVSALMEMAVAHHLNKKIFLLNQTPSPHEHRWAHEVGIMQPVVIDGDLKKVN